MYWVSLNRPDSKARQKCKQHENSQPERAGTKKGNGCLMSGVVQEILNLSCIQKNGHIDAYYIAEMCDLG